MKHLLIFDLLTYEVLLLISYPPRTKHKRNKKYICQRNYRLTNLEVRSYCRILTKLPITVKTLTISSVFFSAFFMISNVQARCNYTKVKTFKDTSDSTSSVG